MSTLDTTSAATVTAKRAEGRLLHPALSPPQGSNLADAELGDRQRVAVLLQAAAVLSHLRRAGWRLAGDLAGATLRDDGVLCGVAAEPGSADDWGPPLRAVFAALFGDGGEVGRGAGRRAARELRDAWARELVPLQPDRAVADVLAAAPFLWEPPFAAARRALAAGWAGETVRLWLAGPDGATRRMLAKARTLDALEELLASDGARELWGERRSRRRTPREQSVKAEPVEHAERAAEPPRRDSLAVAAALLAAGRYVEALERIAGDDGVPARLLAAWCQHHLGKSGAARRTVAQLMGERLAAAEELDLADLAVRVTLEEGDLDDARSWLTRAGKAAGGKLGWRGALLAGEVAAVSGDLTALDDALLRSRVALADTRTAWRWYRLEALRAELAANVVDYRGDGPVEALRRCRRDLAPADAALLWDGVAAIRLRRGDLVGAERAAAHAGRLLQGGGGRQRRRTLHRLVEARVRRGRLFGVEEALEGARVEARLAEGARGRDPELQDAALRVRVELVRGRPGAAWQLAEGALPALDTSARGELAVLGARALGWLGRAEEARRLLATREGDAERVLEREELPALWAHAGDRERAVASASGPLHHLWEAVLAGSHPSRGRWADLDALEPYRAARLVFDFERLTPGLVPVPRVRRAIATLRRLAAGELAAQLEGRLTGPWDALSAHLAESTHDEDGLFRLFAAAGAERAYLAMRTRAGDQVLLAGPGGDEELVAQLGDGHLVLRAARIDPVVKTLFRLLLKQLPAMRAATAGQPVPGIVGESPALLSALARLPRLAQGEVPIVILGESGTGKELVARQVHRLSPRANGPFLPINCAALSESLLLEDLFGHAKGAFTGADRDRAGIFETARGGTVFLDEIGDLPLAAQGKLLRVLQEKEVRRLGESAPRTVDVRVVAATHRDLAEMVRDKSFREDLYYRLRVAVVELPPLRERGGDVVLLAEHFLARTSRGKRPCRLARPARERLLAHHWP
ncbi:MAG TPA: sigma 54-interacting transcriptional regulator, partial [Thermoanaerobaculia bacterium]|nr:sigma 54-interacting transcriptional regulator [Thermoanaerobaculia bacterium]